MIGKANRPVPVPTAYSEPFWSAAAEGRLAIQRCRDCQTFIHPPAPACPECRSSALDYASVSGHGAIYAYTIVRQPLVQGFERAVPYACLAVELAEQPGLLVTGNLVEAEPEAARVGLPVEATFESIGEAISLPQFRPRPQS